MEAGVRTGGCLCGAVRYSVRGEPVHVRRCHCADCRKESGSAFTVYALWPVEAFELSGEISSYDGRGFCPRCGSRLLDTAGGDEGLVEIRIGSLDDAPFELKPDDEIWVKRRESWLPAVNGAAQWPEGAASVEPRGMSVRLRPMEDEEFDAWVPRLQEEYAGDLVRDYGLTPDDARARAAAEIDGHRPAGHSVFAIEVEGEPVGHLWLVERRDAYEPTLSVYDVDVDEPYRGRGYGKAAMVFAEEEARRRGLTRIALRVGARNDVARNLYRSLGFEEHEVAMSKPV